MDFANTFDVFDDSLANKSPLIEISSSNYARQEAKGIASSKRAADFRTIVIKSSAPQPPNESWCLSPGYSYRTEGGRIYITRCQSQVV